MKKILILQLFLFICFMHAQEAVLTTGGDATGNGGSVSYSVGQVFYQTNTGTNVSVSEGVQQAYEISLEVDETTTNLRLQIYPNPTNNYLNLTVTDATGLTYHLYNMQGKLIKTAAINSPKTTIRLEGLAKATYFLNVLKNNQTIKTFKIIKK